MGRAHSNAYLQVNHFFPREHKPVLKACCARPEEKDKLEKFAKAWGYESMELDWKKLIARPDIDLIDVCVPNVLHHDIVIAAAKAGKMVVCEKPLAMNAEEAEEMVAAVEKAGVANMVSFNYRRVPAISLAKQIIDEGRIGRPFHYRATYNQDYTISADVPQGGMALWRLDARVAGSGVTGDLLAHSIDTAEWLNGPIQTRRRPHRDVHQGAEARRDGQGRAGHDRRRLHVPGHFRQRLVRHVREHPLRPRPEELQHLRAQRRERLGVLRPGRSAHLAVLPLRRPGHRQEDRGPPDRLAADPRDELRASRT